MVTRLVTQPLDGILKRYGDQLTGMGQGKARRVMGRAVNYEGARMFTQVKRSLRQQTSIPTAIIAKGTKTIKASTGGAGAIEFTIVGTGKPLSLKLFTPRQFGPGTKATVWGHRQLFPHAFMGPRPGQIASSLGGNVFVRSGRRRLPIEMMFGPGIANELVKDQAAQSFYTSLPRILDRVGKEIAAILRGF